MWKYHSYYSIGSRVSFTWSHNGCTTIKSGELISRDKLPEAGINCLRYTLKSGYRKYHICTEDINKITAVVYCTEADPHHFTIEYTMKV